MRSRWIGFLVAALALAFSVWAFPRLPETVATHWNMRGEADGYSSRLFAVLMLPAGILALRLLASLFPRIDPKNARYESFLGTYWLIMNVAMLFMGALHILVVGSGLGWPVDTSRVVPVGVGMLFILLGNYLGRVEPNWFLGIRTPWTLSSDTVWRKVHRTGGWLFVAGGVVFLLSALAPRVAMVPLFVVTIALVGVVPVVQSYVLWRRERRLTG